MELTRIEVLPQHLAIVIGCGEELVGAPQGVIGVSEQHDIPGEFMDATLVLTIITCGIGIEVIMRGMGLD